MTTVDPTTLSPEELAAMRPVVAVWTPDQAGRFLDAAARERLYPLFHPIACRGLRRGEAVALRWEDVHFGGRSLRSRSRWSKWDRPPSGGAEDGHGHPDDVTRR